MGLTLMSATNHGLKCQSQNRLQPRREIAATNAKRMATTALQFQGFSQSLVDEQNDMMMTLAATKQLEYDMQVRLAETKKTHKLSSGLQNRGLSQIRVGDKDDIVINGKIGGVMHCGFVNGEHRFTACPKRLKIKESATEYLLSVDTPQIGVNISNRLKYSMPLSDGGGKGDVYDQIDNAWLNTNFIIQDACLVLGKILGHFDSMNFCVSFLTY